MSPLRMTFYAVRDPDGNIHVDNVVGGYFGQHHLHTPDDFERWMTAPSPKVQPEDIIWIDSDAPCYCGLDAPCAR